MGGKGAVDWTPSRRRSAARRRNCVRRTGCRTPVQYIFAPEPITEEEIEARKSKLMVDILVKGGSGWQDPLVEHLGSQEMEAPPPPPHQRRTPARRRRLRHHRRI